MAFFKEELSLVKAFVFDVDGVLSRDISPLDNQGEPMRTANVKDGFAIRKALLKGFPMAIISGAKNENIRLRYSKLGVSDIYISVSDKLRVFNDWLAKTGLQADQIMYMGDDLPDYPVMAKAGVPTCPADAVTEIKLISKYISDCRGGEGCVRDVIEQVMRAQKLWSDTQMSETSSF